MRRLLLVLMILLLPVRGWMGDAMAMQALAHDSASTQFATIFVAKNDRQYSQKSVFLHQNHVQAPRHGTVGDHPLGHHGQERHEGQTHAACNACDMCHSSVLVVPTLNWNLGINVQSLPQGNIPSDTSAERAQGQKPPIS